MKGFLDFLLGGSKEAKVGPYVILPATYKVCSTAVHVSCHVQGAELTV